MMTLTTGFRQVGGALIACLLLAFVVGPTLDWAICATDGERPAAESHQLSAQSAKAGSQEDQEHDRGSDVCIHGHCHHASPLVGAELAQSSVPIPVMSHTAPRNLGFPPSSTLNRLEEPPRA